MLFDVNNQNTSTESSIDGNESAIIPSVLNQTNAHKSRSNRYSVVKTSDTISAFEKEKFTWAKVSEEKSRKPHYQGFGTHMLCFEHPDLAFEGKLGSELRPRLYFRNSYHGRTKMVINLGLYRLYCNNGLMLGSLFKSIELKHIGLEQDEVKQIIKDMQKEYSEKVVPTILSLKDTLMSKHQQMQFAEAVLKERVSSNEKFVRGEHEKLLISQRTQDNDDTMWNVLNRVQENLGLNFRASPVELSYVYEAMDKDDNVIQKERKLSGLAGIQKVTHMNRFLFDRIVDFMPAQNEEVEMMAA